MTSIKEVKSNQPSDDDIGNTPSRVHTLEQDNSHDLTPDISGSDQDLENSLDEKLIENDPDIDGGYAWVIVIAIILYNFSTWGGNSGFAIYLSTYLENNRFENADKMDYAYIGGIAFGVGVLFSPFITVLIGLIGFKNVLIIGNCLQFTALMLASFATKLWQLYLTQGLMNSFGLAFISIPAITLLPQYFKKKRVLAMGLGTAGSGLGGIVYNLAMNKLVEVRSVSWALRAQSIMQFGMVWIAILITKSKTENYNIEFKLYDAKIMKSLLFWLIIFFTITCSFGYVILLYQLANFTVSLGYSEYQGSIVSAMVQVGSCFGRPPVGYLSDRFGSATVGSIIYIIVGIFALAMWIPARNYATVIIFALIQGALMGSLYVIIAPLIARCFGINKMNMIFAYTWFFLGLSGIFSPVIGLKLTTGSASGYDPTRYVDPAIFSGVVFLASGVSLLLIKGHLTARDYELNAKETLLDTDKLVDTKVPIRKMITNIFRKNLQPA
ncbi:unnamed protein product [Candida verbasci]|uniref:Transporter MCH2 n=1 Tax=Candida verbasci TaxID=1227364 RepID=A0A9W4TUK6_9ASCO|nr:unnamed protein product [Candida verbasci]